MHILQCVIIIIIIIALFYFGKIMQNKVYTNQAQLQKADQLHRI